MPEDAGNVSRNACRGEFANGQDDSGEFAYPERSTTGISKGRVQGRGEEFGQFFGVEGLINKT